MATWPDTTELTTFLTAAGFLSSPETSQQLLLNLQQALDAAVEQWNEDTHYWPFLSTGNTTESRDFYPSGGQLLDLDSGLLYVYSLTTDQTYQSTTQSLGGGNAKVNVQDYRLLPGNAPQKQMPYTMVLMGWVPNGVISVAGEWGYCREANLPKTARLAVMAQAAINLMPQLTYYLTHGGLTLLQQGDSTKRWGNITDLTAGWQMMYSAALKQFVRPRISS